jgi:antagonist of KipI
VSLHVHDPGLLTTIQDAGRFEVGYLGGPTLEVTEPLTIGLAGADLGGTAGSGMRLLPGRSYRLDAGTTIAFGGRPSNLPRTGSRAYLAIPGGVDVPLVLGSRSTCLAAGFGGLDGRPLRADDRIAPADPGRRIPPLLWPVDEPPPGDAARPRRPIRVVAGAELGGNHQGALDHLVRPAWLVAPDSDRMGVRLDGPPIRVETNGELLSHGVPWGAVQLPPSGLPIVLAADHQSTGGYPVIAVVATVDHDLVGQLAPGDDVRFELIDLATAREALVEEEARFARLTAQLEEARRVAEETDWAGA